MPPKRSLGPRSARLGSLGRAIERQRRAAGISQEELGSRAGVHTTHISGLERGQRNPTYETLAEVAAGLGLGLAELVAEAEEFEHES